MVFAIGKGYTSESIYAIALFKKQRVYGVLLKNPEGIGRIQL